MKLWLQQMVLCLAAWAFLACGAAAQQNAAALPNYDLEADILPEVLVIFPTKGPAWWKATKGDSTVWIFALAPAVVPVDQPWNQALFRRRVAGARAMILAPVIETQIDGKFKETLPRYLNGRVDVVRRAERQLNEFGRPVTVGSIFTLKRLHFRRGRLGFHLRNQVRSMATGARVPLILPPRLSYVRSADEFSPNKPGVVACAEQLLGEAETSFTAYRAAAKAWSEGRIAKALEAPAETSVACGTAKQAELSRKAIEWQTNQIAKALETPGKVVAIVNMRQLLAREGILQRLRDQGYSIADPKKPLGE